MNKQLSLLLLLLCIFLPAFSDSPICLYEKWKSIPSQELMKMGTRYDARSPDSALVCYSIVADRLRDSASGEDNKILARALNNMGFIYGAYYFDYKKALELFEESSEVAVKYGYDSHLPYIHLNIGGTYLACNMMYNSKQLFADEIWENLGKAFNDGIMTRQYDVALVAFLNMGQMHLFNPNIKNINGAIKNLESADFPKNVKLVPLVRVYAEGIKNYNNKDFDQALSNFQSMISMIPADDVNKSRLEIVSLQSVVEALKASGKYNEAIMTANELLNKAKTYGASDDETRIYRTLAELYEKIDQADTATECLLQYHQKKDSTLSTRDMTMLSKLQLANELKGIQSQLEKERAHRRLILIICGAAFVFILLLGFYLVSIIRSRRKLQQYVKELYRKNVELIRATQRERELREENTRYVDEKYSASNLTAPESRKIADKIINIMENTELITNPDFSLIQLAEIIGYPYKQISQVVNETLGKNFRTLLNEYRIREACTRLLDTDNYGQYTIEHIAESVGFNSRSNFSVMFKKITGLTPVQFQKNALSEA